MKKSTEVMLSSNSDEWETPQSYYDELNSEYVFVLDPCTDGKNGKAPFCFTREEDALTKEWWPYRRVFMNPPYGRATGIWIEKAYKESLKGCLVVCLIPARTETKYWHNFCAKGRITLIKGRLKFRGFSEKYQKIVDDIAAPFPSALVVFPNPLAKRRPRPKDEKNLHARPRFKCTMCGNRSFRQTLKSVWVCSRCTALIVTGEDYRTWTV